MNVLKKSLAILLSVAMVFTLMPTVPAFAAEAEIAADGDPTAVVLTYSSTVKDSSTSNSSSEYIISTTSSDSKTSSKITGTTKIASPGTAATYTINVDNASISMDSGASTIDSNKFTLKAVDSDESTTTGVPGSEVYYANLKAGTTQSLKTDWTLEAGGDDGYKTDDVSNAVYFGTAGTTTAKTNDSTKTVDLVIVPSEFVKAVENGESVDITVTADSVRHDKVVMVFTLTNAMEITGEVKNIKATYDHDVVTDGKTEKVTSVAASTDSADLTGIEAGVTVANGKVYLTEGYGGDSEVEITGNALSLTYLSPDDPAQKLVASKVVGDYGYTVAVADTDEVGGVAFTTTVATI